MVERLTVNQDVAGSSPARGAKFIFYYSMEEKLMNPSARLRAIFAKRKKRTEGERTFIRSYTGGGAGIGAAVGGTLGGSAGPNAVIGLGLFGAAVGAGVGYGIANRKIKRLNKKGERMYTLDEIFNKPARSNQRVKRVRS